MLSSRCLFRRLLLLTAIAIVAAVTAAAASTDATTPSPTESSYPSFSPTSSPAAATSPTVPPTGTPTTFTATVTVPNDSSIGDVETKFANACVALLMRSNTRRRSLIAEAVTSDNRFRITAEGGECGADQDSISQLPDNEKCVSVDVTISPEAQGADAGSAASALTGGIENGEFAAALAESGLDATSVVLIATAAPTSSPTESPYPTESHFPSSIPTGSSAPTLPVVTGDGSVALQGSGNEALADFAVVSGGSRNKANAGDFAVISGGEQNVCGALGASIGGGSTNAILRGSSFVGRQTSSTTGGGQNSTIVGGRNNVIIDSPACLIGGGLSNKIHRKGENSVIGGGKKNVIKKQFATIGGGEKNKVFKAHGTIGGGRDNRVKGLGAAVPGGESNTASGDSSVAMGRGAKASEQSFVLNLFPRGRLTSKRKKEFIAQASEFVFKIGGVKVELKIDNIQNLVDVLNGSNTQRRRNLAAAAATRREEDGMTAEELRIGIEEKEKMQSENDAVVERLTGELFELEGLVESQEEEQKVGKDKGNHGRHLLLENHDADAYAAFLEEKIVLRQQQRTTRSLQQQEVVNEIAPLGLFAVIAGGEGNEAAGQSAVVSGGQTNKAGGTSSTISGGQRNSAIGDYATVGGGSKNRAEGIGAVVGGGEGNVAPGTDSYIGGGTSNKARSDNCVVGGGEKNKCEKNSGGGFIGGGKNNKIKGGDHAVVLGGKSNRASGKYSVVMGGRSNRAEGKHAIAVGRSASATGDHTFSANLRKAGKSKTRKPSTFQVKTDVLSLCVSEECVRVDKNNVRIFKKLIEGQELLPPPSQRQRRRRLGGNTTAQQQSAEYDDLEEREEKTRAAEEQRDLLVELRNKHEILTEVLHAQINEMEELRSEIELERTKLHSREK